LIKRRSSFARLVPDRLKSMIQKKAKEAKHSIYDDLDDEERQMKIFLTSESEEELTDENQKHEHKHGE